MKYNIVVDRITCISSGICYKTHPMHFEADYENKSAVIGGRGYEISKADFEDEMIEDAKKAMSECPAQAITVREVI